MTEFYPKARTVYESPTASDFTAVGIGRAAIAILQMEGARLPIVVLRYDAPPAEFDSVANGAIDGWSKALEASEVQIRSNNFDLLILCLKDGRQPGSGPAAYDIAEVGVVVREVEERSVLVAVQQQGNPNVIENLVMDVSQIRLSSEILRSG